MARAEDVRRKRIRAEANTAQAVVGGGPEDDGLVVVVRSELDDGVHRPCELVEDGRLSQKRVRRGRVDLRLRDRLVEKALPHRAAAGFPVESLQHHIGDDIGDGIPRF